MKSNSAVELEPALAAPETRAPAPSGMPRWLAFLLAVMVLCWASNFVASKVALREMPGMLVVGLRLAIAGLLMLAVYLYQLRRSTSSLPSLQDGLRIALLGIGGVSMNQVLFTLGVERTSVAHGALITAMTPVMVFVLSALRKQEVFTPRRLLGMGIAILGVVALQFAPVRSAAQSSLLGDVLVMGGAFAFALFTVFGKEMTGRHGSIAVTAISYIGGGLLLLPLTVWLSQTHGLHQVSGVAWGSLLYMAVFPSVLCYLIYYEALRYVEASRLISLAYLQPVLATAMALLLLGEAVSGAVIAGGTLVLCGLVVAGKR